MAGDLPRGWQGKGYRAVNVTMNLANAKLAMSLGFAVRRPAMNPGEHLRAFKVQPNIPGWTATVWQPSTDDLYASDYEVV